MQLQYLEYILHSILFGMCGCAACDAELRMPCHYAESYVQMIRCRQIASTLLVYHYTLV